MHRDIKPENMLFAGEAGDQLKLCDFGSAERFSALKGPKANAFTDFVSTAWYTAPEVLTHNYRYLPPPLCSSFHPPPCRLLRPRCCVRHVTSRD